MDSGRHKGSLLWKVGVKKLVLIQVGSAFLLAGILLIWWDWGIAVSLAAGGVLVGVNTCFMARVFAASEVSQKVIYRSAVFRYLGFLASLFVLAFAGADLLVVCGGVAVAYFSGFLVSAKCAVESVNSIN